MKAPGNILYLKNKEVDKHRWDKCIAASFNSLIYAQSFYLDAMCPGWSAIADENYKWVFPLTHRTKYGVTYLYQPALTQQLGLFSTIPYNEVPLPDIINLLQKKFRFCEVSINFDSPSALLDAMGTISKATNFILPLQPTYKHTWMNYGADLKRNLNRSKKFELRYQETSEYKQAISYYKEYYAPRMPQVTLQDYDRFELLATEAASKGKLFCRQVLDKQDELLAIALFLQDERRLYNIMNTTTPKGRKAEANHFLVDQLIREFSETSRLLDFEGSDLPGVKAFYSNFGSINQEFFMVRYNHLPLTLKWLKR